MMTYDRADLVLSERCWWAQKIDGYQAVIEVNPGSVPNCIFQFRNGVAYETQIPYKGTRFVMQATVCFDGQFKDEICINRVYYEDMIISAYGGHNFCARAVSSYKMHISGFPFTMKQWNSFANNPVFMCGKNSEGIVFQLDDVDREMNGAYKSNHRSAYFLKDHYTIDVTMVGDKFYLDGVEYTLNEGVAPVREIEFVSWDPPKFNFIRDRWDRAPMAFEHNGRKDNSLNSKFVSDYRKAIVLDAFNKYTSNIVSIDGTAASLLYSHYKRG
jgi:hypothetical protein